MTLKRDARGTLRDYARELEGKGFSIFSSFFSSSEVFCMTLSTASLIKPDNNLPWGCFSSFNETNPTHLSFSVSAAKGFRVMTIFFWRYKTQVVFAIVQPISIDMVNKCPTICRFSDNVVMQEVFTKPCVSVIAFVKLCAYKFVFVYISINNCVSYKIVSPVIQWCFNYISIDNSVMNDSLFVNGHKSSFTSGPFPIVMKLTEAFSETWAVTPWNFAYHANIISKNNKISRSIHG